MSIQYSEIWIKSFNMLQMTSWNMFFWNTFYIMVEIFASFEGLFDNELLRIVFYLGNGLSPHLRPCSFVFS